MNILEDCEKEDLPTMYPQRLLARINKQHHMDTGSEIDESFNIRVDLIWTLHQNLTRPLKQN